METPVPQPDPKLVDVNTSLAKDIKLLAVDPIPSIQVGNGTPLTWLATVRTSQVPLFQIVGPTWDCVTDDEDTVSWLGQHLLNHDGDDAESPWWASAPAESDVGILFRSDGHLAAWKDGPLITEILFYAACVPTTSSPAVSIPTPPQSSPGLELDNASQHLPTIRVRALPLSSQLRPDAKVLGSVSAFGVGEDDSNIVGVLFPGFEDPVPVPPVKRDRLSSLFEQATYQNKRFKDKGGDSVARAVSRNGAPTQASITSRSPSIDTVSDFKPPLPFNRQDPLDRTRRSSLMRVVSASDLDKKSTLADDPSTRNKTTLQRAVLTGMRLYGLQQRKRPQSARSFSRAESEGLGSPSESTTQAEDDEFKNVYHQTYKAAAFAQRKRFANENISQEDMRDIVDKILALFCQDSFTEMH